MDAVGVLKPRKSGPPEAVQDGGCRRRRLLAQRRACCPGLPRGLVRVAATRPPPSAAPAPRAAMLVGRLVPTRKSSRLGKCASHQCVAVVATSRTRQDLRGMSAHVMCSSGGSGQRLPGRNAECADMPASAEKQPAWQMCKPPVRGSGGDLAHAPGSAGHVRTCHVQLWWQRPAAALTERRMRHQLAVASQPAALAPDDGTRLTSSLRPRARARICGAEPHISCAALVAVASGCLN